MSQKTAVQPLPFTADVAFQTGDVVFATDRLGHVVYWNKEAEEVSGYKSEEVLGKPYSVACRMETEGGAAIDLAGILSGRDFAGARRCHTRAGDEVAIYLFATAGRNQAGEAAGVVFVGRNVTSLWSAEAAIQASADKYRVLFEKALDAAAIADMHGRLLEANPAFVRLYGYAVPDNKGLTFVELAAPEDRSTAVRLLTNLSAGRQVARTMRMRRKDGESFVVDLQASTMTVGGERRILLVTRDVSERVRAEQARAQSELMYRTVFESANDAVFVEAVDGRILDVNRHGCELLGYSKGELLKMSVADVVPAESRVWLQRLTDAVLRDGTFRAEAVRVHKDGRHIPVEISASTMGLAGTTLVLSIARDITERKQAEQALRESEEKFRSFSEQSPNMIFINSRGRVVYANQKSVDGMGYTREEFYAPDFDFRKLIAPESADLIKEVYARHGRGEEVEPYEYSLVTKDGRRIEAIITTKLIEYGGTRAILGIVTDITERKRAERALHEEKERSQTYLALAGSMLVALDASGTITLLNRRACQVLGVTEAEGLGRNWFDTYVPERDRPQVKSVFDALMSGNLEPVEHYDNPVLTASGEERLIAWHNVLLRDEQGRPTGTLSSGEDVTEREEAVRALRESEQRYRTALEAMRDPVHVADSDLRIVMANQAFTRWLRQNGLDDAVLGKTVFEAFPFLPDRVREEYGRVFATGEPVVTEEETTIAGRTFITETTKTPVTEHGKVVRVLTSVHDVTEWKRLARVAQETADELRAVLDNSPGAIVGEGEGVLVYANQQFARLLGYDSPAEVIGRPAGEFDAPQDRELLSGYTRLREQGKDVPTSYSYHGLRRDGTVIPLEATVSTYRSLGRLHVLAFIREQSPSQ
ncbi:PAS domain S-box protein [candidate division WOR-3 bacterium]|nr:PAS domain S-box protein [candidate division WOR-3 bacterium]